MYHPWRHLREHLSDWIVEFAILTPGILGTTDVDAHRIVLDRRQLQRERRCTLTHEMIHAEHGDIGRQHPHREAWVEQEAARRLIPTDALIEVCRWARTAQEAADELWVDVHIFNCRVEHLHPAERAAIVAAIRAREDAA